MAKRIATKPRKTSSSRTRTSKATKSSSRSKSSKTSSALMSDPFNFAKNKRIYTVLIVAIGLVAALLIYRANAGEFGAVAGGFNNCDVSGGVVVKESSSSLKRNVSVCQLDSGKTFSPTKFSNKIENTYTQVMTALISRGYNSAKTCAFVKSTGGNGSIDLYGLGTQGSKITANITSTEYQEICTTQSITGSNQTPTIKINSGTINVSSMIITGKVVATPPSNTGAYVTPADIGNTVGPKNNISYQTVNGTVSLGSAGQTYENKIVNGCLKVSANNVVIKNVTVNYVKGSCDNPYAIRLDNSSGVKFTNFRLDCKNDDSGHLIFFNSPSWTYEYSEVTGCDYPFYMITALGNSKFTNSVIHNTATNNATGSAEGSHTEAFRLQQLSGGTLTVENSFIAYDRNPGCCQTGLVFSSGASSATVYFNNNFIDQDWERFAYGNDTHNYTFTNTVVGRRGLAQISRGLSTVMYTAGRGTVSCMKWDTGGIVPSNLVNAGSYTNNNCPSWMP
jgi:hypothetical protein